ncbi:MAG: phosphoribosyl-ATP pyrophosphohydrolase [Brevundimonas sp.]|uniref:Phosphoribosyl-ATP pyrophosphohydrolase n=1 Tax=Brevundimonas albigilva TaxID=1312364 RepID=A0ABY4SSC8_9CAUL|nr:MULTISPECIES: phosphoribosyl-ATP pyrophosphohydrolase [Brevundimonas]MCV0413560.1 phosphoribosyl-ATP pyrophosphohydrolase [Brevundimonas sp.]UQV18579.1 phosphoribosyl-ATP pyrophosphohydrolase [Brevundimonas albigilva]URI16651.1 phosphoribosyl-ATP pyrophosphohydrolase [Brevundimonas albigilva]
MDLKALQADVLRISDIYAAEHAIDRDRDWALLKLQEELGELTAEHLRLSQRARGKPDALALGDEAADVLGMLLIYCARAGVDLDEAMRRKWLRWLEPRKGDAA